MTPDITDLIVKHELMRKQGLNMIASENTLSPKVREALTSDLAGRYHADFYGGSNITREIIAQTEALAREIYGAKHAMVTPLSGNICDLALLFSFTKADETVAAPSPEAGGYPLGYSLFERTQLPLPAVEGTFDIDVPAAETMLIEKRPPLTILGASYLTFPHPVAQFRKIIDENSIETKLAYDGSHVLGLIGTETFQDPLREGADIMVGSTHKSLYGPQGGLILTNSDECYEAMKNYVELNFDVGIGLVDNPHPNRIAALGVALEELKADHDYGKRIINNSRTLAKALHGGGLPMKFSDRNFTDSHQIFIDLPQPEAEKLFFNLEKAGIFIDSSGRIGTSENTHLGMCNTEMETIASLIISVHKDGPSESIKNSVIKLAKDFRM